MPYRYFMSILRQDKHNTAAWWVAENAGSRTIKGNRELRTIKGNRELLAESPDMDYDANRIKQQGG